MVPGLAATVNLTKGLFTDASIAASKAGTKAFRNVTQRTASDNGAKLVTNLAQGNNPVARYTRSFVNNNPNWVSKLPANVEGAVLNFADNHLTANGDDFIAGAISERLSQNASLRNVLSQTDGEGWLAQRFGAVGRALEKPVAAIKGNSFAREMDLRVFNAVKNLPGADQLQMVKKRLPVLEARSQALKAENALNKFDGDNFLSNLGNRLNPFTTSQSRNLSHRTHDGVIGNALSRNQQNISRAQLLEQADQSFSNYHLRTDSLFDPEGSIINKTANKAQRAVLGNSAPVNRVSTAPAKQAATATQTERQPLFSRLTSRAKALINQPGPQAVDKPALSQAIEASELAKIRANASNPVDAAIQTQLHTSRPTEFKPLFSPSQTRQTPEFYQQLKAEEAAAKAASTVEIPAVSPAVVQDSLPATPVATSESNNGFLGLGKLFNGGNGGQVAQATT